jgi:two-component system KDP operon response regulator KdpE
LAGKQRRRRIPANGPPLHPGACPMISVDRSKPTVLVVEGEIQLRRLLRLCLGDAGFAVREAETGRAALEEIRREAADAVVLDLEMSDLGGSELLSAMREQSASPVLVLSSSSQEASKVAALDAGADDYLTKPFGSGELAARLRAMLRRIKPAVASNAFRFGSNEVDIARRRVTKKGKAVKLTSMEYALLQLFITHRDKALTHRQILGELWGPKAEGQTHYLRTYLMRLRRKLEDDFDAPKHFQTESGIGYRFVAQP